LVYARRFLPFPVRWRSIVDKDDAPSGRSARYDVRVWEQVARRGLVGVDRLEMVE
jgi:hypothetical protein